MRLISILQVLGLLAIVVRPAAAAPIQVDTEGHAVAAINATTNSNLQEHWAEPQKRGNNLGISSLPKYAEQCIAYAWRRVKNYPQSWQDKPISRWSKPEDFCNSNTLNIARLSPKWEGFAPDFADCIRKKTWLHDKPKYWESVVATEDWMKKLCGDEILKKLPTPLRVAETAYTWAEGPEANGYGAPEPSS